MVGGRCALSGRISRRRGKVHGAHHGDRLLKELASTDGRPEGRAPATPSRHIGRVRLCASDPGHRVARGQHPTGSWAGTRRPCSWRLAGDPGPALLRVAKRASIRRLCDRGCTTYTPKRRRRAPRSTTTRLAPDRSARALRRATKAGPESQPSSGASDPLRSWTRRRSNSNDSAVGWMSGLTTRYGGGRRSVHAAAPCLATW